MTEMAQHTLKSLPGGGDVIFFVDEEKLKGFIQIVTQEQLPTFNEVQEVVASVFFKDLLDLDVIRDITEHLEPTHTCERRRVIKGRQPDEGIDGKLLLLAKPMSKTPQQSSENSSLYELGLFDNIEPGRIVARLYPEKDGKDGIDVFGKPIKSKKGAPLKITFDDSVKREKVEGYEVLTSNVHGYLEHKNGQLRVCDTLVISGDVDLEVGNIHFVGKIDVQGNIGTGFFVKGDRGVVVKGNLSKDVTLSSPLGEVIVKGYAPQCVIVSPSVTVSVIHEAKIEASKVFILKESSSSTIIAQEGIDASKASIFGGEFITVSGLNAKNIGNDAEISTIVTLSSAIEASTEFISLTQSIKKHEEAAKLLQAHLGPLAYDAKKRGVLTQEHKLKMDEFLKKLKEVEKSKITQIAKLNELKASEKDTPPSYISWSNTLYPGVVFHHHEFNHPIKTTKKGPKSITFDKSTNEFHECDYQEIKISNEDKNGKK